MLKLATANRLTYFQQMIQQLFMFDQMFAVPWIIVLFHQRFFCGKMLTNVLKKLHEISADRMCMLGSDNQIGQLEQIFVLLIDGFITNLIIIKPNELSHDLPPKCQIQR